MLFLAVYVCAVLGVTWETRTLPDLAKYVGPAITICGGVAAWSYLAASTRLGVVDLFACEIGTLCRVGTLFDIGKLYIQMRERYVAKLAPGKADDDVKEKASVSEKFDSDEEYFPVFAANSHDLEALEALVVGHITEFYTYMKAARDLRRNLPNTPASEAPAVAANLIYVVFLGYESGRKAIEKLIEFDPTRAENMVVILLTEIVCYGALLQYYKDDLLRFPRLKPRWDDYKQIIPALYNEVMQPNHGVAEDEWNPAKHTTTELARRYKDVFHEDMSEAVARIAKGKAAA